MAAGGSGDQDPSGAAEQLDRARLDLEVDDGVVVRHAPVERQVPEGAVRSGRDDDARQVDARPAGAGQDLARHPGAALGVAAQCGAADPVAGDGEQGVEHDAARDHQVVGAGEAAQADQRLLRFDAAEHRDRRAVTAGRATAGTGRPGVEGAGLADQSGRGPAGQVVEQAGVGGVPPVRLGEAADRHPVAQSGQGAGEFGVAALLPRVEAGVAEQRDPAGGQLAGPGPGPGRGVLRQVAHRAAEPPGEVVGEVVQVAGAAVLGAALVAEQGGPRAGVRQPGEVGQFDVDPAGVGERGTGVEPGRVDPALTGRRGVVGEQPHPGHRP